MNVDADGCSWKSFWNKVGDGISKTWNKVKSTVKEVGGIILKKAGGVFDNILKVKEPIMVKKENGLFSQKIDGGPWVDPDAKGWGPNGEFTIFQKIMGALGGLGMVVGTIGAAVYFFCPPVGQTMFGLGYVSTIFFFAISGLGGAT